MSEPTQNRLDVLRTVNRLCDEYEYALSATGSPSLSEFLAALPQAVSATAARHLVALDIDYRRLRGETPSENDYQEIDSLDSCWLQSLCSTTSEIKGSLTSTAERNAAPPFAKGAELGDYVIGDLIGAGGMGTVYEATHVAMRRRVAIKVIGSQDASALEVERFRREAQAAARLSHPNVVRAYDAGEQDGHLYLAMELINGENLEQRIARSGPLTVAESINVIRQAALGLAHAHEQDLIHRDVKPSNLVITAAQEVKVLDLGLARLAEPGSLMFSEEPLGEGLAAGSNGTSSAGQLLGTIDYVAPEQAIDPSTASHAVDIYALGCTWGFLLTGEAHYGHLPTGQRLIAHQVGEVASLRGHRPDLPKSLDRLFQRMVAKQPDERPASMHEVVRALDANKADQAKGKLDRRVRVWSLLFLTLTLGLVLVGLEPATFPQSANATQAVQSGVGFTQRAVLQREAAQKTRLALKRVGVAETPLVLVPAGDFLMGTLEPKSRRKLTENVEFPRHVVTISKSFYLAQTETTHALFRRFVSETGYQTQPEQNGGWAWGLVNGVWRQGPYSWNKLGDYQPNDNDPVTNLTWHDAVAYCKWLTTESIDELRYRLPTEAEWEYACRAGSVTPWEFGDQQQRLGDYAWYLENAGRTPKTVAHKKPNAWGLYDMHGNVAEWCLDRFTETGRFYDSMAKTDPTGSKAGPLRVQRGGNCLSLADEVRSAYRTHQPATNPTRGGFRVAAEAR